MLKKLILLLPALGLSGCITVYGPVKTGTQPDATQNPAGLTSDNTGTKIGNRKPDELLNAVNLYYQQYGLSPVVSDSATGIVAATGNDEQIASRLLDCSVLPQTQNIQESYRVVTQVWSAGEGSNVSVQVSGVAGLTTADGNDKIKPTECRSVGSFERDLLERLRK